MTRWYEDEAFWRAGYALMFSDEAFLNASADVDQLLALIGGQPVSALDLCCGAGRHTMPLAKRDLAITAVDL